MSATIDQRIVEMQFDNRQFEKGVQTSLKTLRDLKKGLDLDGSAESLKKLQKAGDSFSFLRIADGIESLGKKFTGLGMLGTTAMYRISNAAITTGKKLVSALTIDPIRSGLSEYETQINAIQTILSNTRSKGTDIFDVNAALDELNTYADKTIYNFTEMTRNIGTFTAAGVDLDTSTAAIKGIANLAAVSGSTSQQASTAMYQLSQALASGTIRLMDWNSVVNAGMGGEVFQNALKETAKVHGKNIDEMIKKEGSFRETLQNGWLTSEIMLETLQKFTGDLSKEQIMAKGYTEEQADAIVALGKDANDAATKVKTFTQLMDTLKEALQSGWTQSWEYVIGNFEEARELWTNVSDAINSVISKTADARNSLLKGWYEAGGRNDLITGLTDAFSGLWGIVVAVGDAMKEVFPPITVDNLLTLTSGIKEFGAELKYLFRYRDVLTGFEETEKTTEGIKEAITLTQDLKRGLKGDEVKKMQEMLAKLGFEVGEIDGIFGPKTEAALKAFQEKYGLLADGIFGESANLKMAEVLGLGDNTEIEKTSKYVTVFGDALLRVRHIAKGVFSVFRIAGSALKVVWGTFKTGLSLLSPIGNALLIVAESLSTMFINLEQSLAQSKFFESALAKIQTFLAPVGEWAQKASDALLKFFGLSGSVDFTMSKIKTFPQLWATITESISHLDIWDKVKAGYDNIIAAFDAIGPTMKDLYTKAKAYLGDKFTSFLGTVATKVPEYAAKIGQFFIDVFNFIEPYIAKIPVYAEKVGQFFVNMFGKIKGFVAKVPSFAAKIKSFFVGLYNNVRNSERFKKMYAKVTEALSGFITSVKEFFNKIKAAFTEGFEDGGFDENTMGAIFAKTFQSFEGIGEWIKGIFKKLGEAFKWADDFINRIGPGGLIGVISLALGALSIYKLQNSVTNLIKGVNGIVKAFKDGISVKKTTQPLSKTFMQLAIGIGILVASVYAIGSMKPEVFRQGAIAVGVIMASLITLTVLAGKFLKADVAKVVSSTGRAIFELGAAIGIITIAMYLLGKMNPDTLISGAKAVTGIAFGLALFIGAMKLIGATEINYKGLIGLSVSIGILGAIMAMIGRMKPEKILKGVLGLLGVVTVLGLFVIAVNKSLNGAGTLKYGGLFALSVGIGILTGVVFLIGSIKWQGAIQGILGLGAIMLMLGLLVKSMNSLGGNGTIKIAGLIGLTVAIGLLAGMAAVIGSVPVETMITGIGGLIGVILTLKLLNWAAKGLDIKSSVGVLLGLVGLAAVIGVFGYAMNKVKDLDTASIESFAGGLSKMILSFGGVVFALGSLSFGGLFAGLLGLLGIAAVIGGVIAAWGGLSKIDGFQEFMNGGAAGIGEVIGSFAGGFEVGKITAMADGLETLSATKIDTAGLSSSMDAISLLKTFEENIPSEGFGEKLSRAFLGSDLGNFSDDVVDFAEAAKALSDNMSGLTIDTASVQKAVDAATIINGFASAVEGVTITEAIANKIAGGSPFEILCNNIPTFATNIKTVADSVIGLSDSTIRKDTKAAVESTQAIADFLEGIKNVDLEKNKNALSKFFTGDTMTNTVFDQMSKLATSVQGVGSSLSGLADGGFEENVASMESAITSIISLLTLLSSGDIEIESDGWFTDSTLTKVTTQMGSLATAVTNFNDNTKDVDTTRFTTIISSFESMSNALSNISGGISKDAMATLTSSIEQVTSSMTTVGTQMNTALSTGFSSAGVDTSGVQNVCVSMIQAANNFKPAFTNAGLNLGRGLALGMSRSSSIAKSAAVAVARAALNAAKAALGIHSPSKKFFGFGEMSVVGLANGLTHFAKLAVSAAKRLGDDTVAAAQNSASSMSTFITDNMGGDPVIRPIVDLSGVVSGAKAMGEMLNNNSGSIAMSTNVSTAMARSAGVSVAKKNQNGSSNSGTANNTQTNNAVNLTGNTFYVRSEQDIQSLASEIAALTRQQQMGYGAT